MQYSITDIPIYDYKLLLLVGDVKGKTRRIHKLIPEEDDIEGLMRIIDGEYTATTAFRSRCVVIHFTTPPTVNTIAHEAFHAVEFIMDRIGCKHGDKSSEPWAYLLGHITEEIYSKVYAPAPKTGS